MLFYFYLLDYFYMDDKLYLDVINLKKALIENKDVKLLNKFENEMENNDQVKVLVYQFDIAQVNYNDALKHNDPEVKYYYKKMVDCYYNLNQNDVVKQYNKQYEKVKILYDKINDLLNIKV